MKKPISKKYSRYGKIINDIKSRQLYPKDKLQKIRGLSNRENKQFGNKSAIRLIKKYKKLSSKQIRKQDFDFCELSSYHCINPPIYENFDTYDEL